MPASERYDLVVLGGGTGGLVSSLIAAGVGARVALIERQRTGGDCLWTGCVPSKALIAAATLAHRMRHADLVGITSHEPRVEFAAVMDHVWSAIRTIAPQDSPERLRRDGVEVIQDHARFLAPGKLEAGSRKLCFRAAIIATGSEPAVPPIPGLHDADALTTDSLWELRELPRQLTVLGGGPVGCELAQAFARLGARVTLIEMADRLLLKEEPDASALVAARVREDGVEVRLGQRALAVRGASEPDAAADGPTASAHPHELVLESPGGGEQLGYERLLLAVGRTPRTAGLGLERAGVQTDRRGDVLVDRRLRTTARGIYAVGDVTGLQAFTHVAAHHARVATVNALFHARGNVSDALPWVTFTDPEVGRIGLTEAQARARWGGRTIVAEHDYATLDRAITAGEAYGFAKLIADPRGRLVGATVAAPGGGEAIAELTAWLSRGEKLAAVSRVVHAYPTLAEGPARAADAYLAARYSRPPVRALARAALAAVRVTERRR